MNAPAASRVAAPGPAADAEAAEPSLYVVAGHPVAHSQSPFIHAAFAEQTGQSLVYDRLPCAPDAFEATLRAFAEQPAARGANVTVPFKFEAPALCATLSERARLAQAVNVLRFDPQGWHGDNTDGIGLMRDITEHAATPLAGRRVLLLGAGGAAAGVLGPLLETRPALVVVANRSLDKAQALVQRHAAWADRHGVTLAIAPFAQPGDAFDVLINATASSLAGAGLTLPPAVLRQGALAVDLMYGAPAEPFLHWARAQGAQARDGLGMLVEQAAEAFWLWRGVRPTTPPVLAALRARLATKEGP